MGPNSKLHTLLFAVEEGKRQTTTIVLSAGEKPRAPKWTKIYLDAMPYEVTACYEFNEEFTPLDVLLVDGWLKRNRDQRARTMATMIVRLIAKHLGCPAIHILSSCGSTHWSWQKMDIYKKLLQAEDQDARRGYSVSIRDFC